MKITKLVLLTLATLSLAACGGDTSSSGSTQGSTTSSSVPSVCMTKEDFDAFINKVRTEGLTASFTQKALVEGVALSETVGVCAYNVPLCELKTEVSQKMGTMQMSMGEVIKNLDHYQNEGTGYKKAEKKLTQEEAKHIVEEDIKGMFTNFFPELDFTKYSVDNVNSTIKIVGKYEVEPGTFADTEFTYTVVNKLITKFEGIQAAVSGGQTIEQHVEVTSFVAGAATIEAPEIK